MATDRFPTRVRIPYHEATWTRDRPWRPIVLESHRDVRSVNGAGPFDIVAGTQVELPFGATLLNGLVRAAIPVVDRWGNNVGQRRFDVPPEWFLHETSNTQDVAYHEAWLAPPHR